jgi:hypothetical protein
MYNACRHIKSSGDRCESPALHGKNFCFFHDRLHTDDLAAKFGPLRLPVSEDLSSILLALNRISCAIIDCRIDARRAAQLIWIQQLALQVVNRRDTRNDDSIQTIAQGALGEELALPLTLCEPGGECQTCAHNTICARSPYADQCETDDETEYQYELQESAAAGSCPGDEDKDEEEEEEKEEGGSGSDSEDDDGEEDEDGEEEDEDDEEEKKEEGGSGGDLEDDDGEEDEDDGDEDEDDEDQDDEDCPDNESTEELVASAKYLESLTASLKNGDMRQLKRLLKE